MDGQSGTEGGLKKGTEKERDGGTIIIDSNTLIKRTIDFCLLLHDKR